MVLNFTKTLSPSRVKPHSKNEVGNLNAALCFIVRVSNAKTTTEMTQYQAYQSKEGGIFFPTGYSYATSKFLAVEKSNVQTSSVYI